MGFKCPYCPFICPNLYGLKTHVNSQHLPSPRCEICGKPHPTAHHYIRGKGHEAYAYFYTQASCKKHSYARKKNIQNIAYETFKIKL